MLKNPWCTKASNVPITDYTGNQNLLMENVWDRPREEFSVQEAKHVHTPEDLTISNLPDCYTLFSCKLWDTSALLEPNKESFSCIVLLKKADTAEM